MHRRLSRIFALIGNPTSAVSTERQKVKSRRYTTCLFDRPGRILRRREKIRIPKNRQFQGLTAEVGLTSISRYSLRRYPGTYDPAGKVRETDRLHGEGEAGGIFEPCALKRHNIAGRKISHRQNNVGLRFPGRDKHGKTRCPACGQVVRVKSGL